MKEVNIGLHTTEHPRGANYYIRAKSYRRILELIGEKIGLTVSMRHLRNYRLLWGTAIKRPDHDGEIVMIEWPQYSGKTKVIWEDPKQSKNNEHKMNI